MKTDDSSNNRCSAQNVRGVFPLLFCDFYYICSVFWKLRMLRPVGRGKIWVGEEYKESWPNYWCTVSEQQQSQPTATQEEGRGEGSGFSQKAPTRTHTHIEHVRYANYRRRTYKSLAIQVNQSHAKHKAHTCTRTTPTTITTTTKKKRKQIVESSGQSKYSCQHEWHWGPKHRERESKRKHSMRTHSCGICEHTILPSLVWFLSAFVRVFLALSQSYWIH